MRIKASIAALTTLILVMGACGSGGPSGDGTTNGTSSEGAGWQLIDAPPIAGRTGASIASIGDDVYVFGGWDFTCPPTADCAAPEKPPLTDGARLDVSTGTWTTISDMPIGMHDASTVAAGGRLYALSQCDKHPSCPAGRSMVRYDVESDTWELHPFPENSGFYQLAAFGETVVAFASTDEVGEQPDLHFDGGDGTWSALPDDPLPPVFDRQVLEFDGKILTFGSPVGGDVDTKLAAAYDPAADDWVALQDSGTAGFQAWRSDDRIVLNPHFGNARGGLFDPNGDSWSDLPDPPNADTWTNDLAGVTSAQSTTYVSTHGWVLDTDAGEWIEIAGRELDDDTWGEMVVAAGNRLVVFGGERWVDDHGGLVSETWVWTPPPSS